MSDDKQSHASNTVVKVMIVFAATCLFLTYCSWQVFRSPLKSTVDFSPQIRQRLSNDIEEANPDHQGERFDLKDTTQAGKITIIEFYSLFSPECQDMEPKLELLSRARMDVAIRKLNINRVDKREVDLDSPLAKQYEIKSVPAFKIFDPDEKLVAEGEQARHEVDLQIRRDVLKK